MPSHVRPSLQIDTIDNLRAQLRNLAVVFENTIALAQEGEAYLSEIRAMLDGPAVRTNALKSPARLLLVDDDGRLLRSLVRGISDSFSITTATTAGQALALIESQPFDAVVSDFHLPDESGLRVLGFFAQWSPSGVRVLYSGTDARERVIRRALEAGVVHRFVAKPTTVDQLKQLLFELLNHERKAP